MPNRGNLRKNSQGIWEAYNSTRWVPMNQYYAADDRGAYAESQRQTISDIQAALYAMQVDRVYGDNPQNYSFHIGLGELQEDPETYEMIDLAPPEEISLDTLMNRAANQFAGGTIRKADFTGELKDYYKILGWDESAFTKTEQYKDYVPGQTAALSPGDSGYDKDYKDPTNRNIPQLKLGYFAETDKQTQELRFYRLRSRQFFDYQAHGSFIDEVKEYLGMSPETMVSHELPDGRTVTSFEGKQYITEPSATGQWSVKTLKDENNNPVFTLVTDPTGKGSVQQLGSERADQYTMLAQELGGDVSPEALRAAERPTRDAVIPDVVTGYDAVQTSAGRYELVKKEFDPKATEGQRISLGDGREAVKFGIDDYEIITPSPVGDGNTYTDKWGQTYMRQPDGSVSQISPKTIDEQINQALIIGDPDRALALSDFRDRPNAQERFQAALDFAREPGDLMAISAIVRGLVNPPPPADGQIQRIADPPAWVVDAWQQLQSAWGVPDILKTPMMGVSTNQGIPSDFINTPAAGGGFNRKNFEELKNKSSIQDQQITSATVQGSNANLDQQLNELDKQLEVAQDGGNEAEIQRITSQIQILESQQDTTQGREPYDAEIDAAGTEGMFSGAYEGGSIFDVAEKETFDQYVPPEPKQPTSGIGTVNLDTDYVLRDVPGVGRFYYQSGDWRTFNRLYEEDGLDIAKSFLKGVEKKLTEDAWKELKRNAPDGININNAAVDKAMGAVAKEVISNERKLKDAQNEAVTAYWKAVLDKDPDIAILAKGNTLQEKYNVLFDKLGFYIDPDSTLEEVQSIGQSNLQSYLSDQAEFEKLSPYAQYQTLIELESKDPEKYSFPLKMEKITKRVEDEWLEKERKDPAKYSGVGLEEEEYITQGISPQVTTPETATVSKKAPGMSLPLRQEDERPTPDPIGTGMEFATEADKWQETFEGRRDDLVTEYDSPWARTQEEIVAAGGWGGEEQRAMAEIGESTGMEPWEQSEYASGFSKAPESFEVSAPEEVWYGDDLEEDYMSYAGGGPAFKDTLALVGEEGPELVELPAGSEVVPADFTEAMLRGRRPRRMANGGLVPGASLNYGLGPKIGRLRYEDGEQEYPQDIPAGVSQLMSGRPIQRPRSLFRPAGLTVPSAQAMRNLIPEETEAYRELGRLTGIPDKAYEREFKEAVPGGVSRVEQPRFTPRRMRRL